MISFIVEDGGRTERLELPSLPITIGRSAKAAIALRDEQSSRQHARIEAGRDGFEIHDLDSANGTYRNGERVKRAAIQRGDRITIGEAVITFLGGDLQPVVADPPPAIPGLELGKSLGRGVLCDVYLARQAALDRDVVVKVLRPEWRGVLAVSTRFQKLARRQARIHTRGLASGIDVGETDGVPWFVVELLEGETLESRVRRAMVPDAREAVRILREVLEVVRAVHAQGEVLGHLHAASVLIGPEGRVGIASLGFPLPKASQYPEEQVAELASLPPEAARDPDGAGPRGDLYQVGALAAHLLSGRPVRTVGDVPATLDAVTSGEAARFEPKKGVPDELRDWITRLLQNEPGDRQNDAESALSHLEDIASRLESSSVKAAAVAGDIEDRGAPTGPTAEEVRRFKLISRSVFVVIFVGANLGLYFGLTGFFDRRREEQQAEETRLLEIRRAKALEEARARGLMGSGGGPSRERLEKEASSAYEALETRVAAMLTAGRRLQALDALEAFERKWRGTAARALALERRAGIKNALLEDKRRAFQAVEAALALQDLPAAERALAKAREIGSRLDPAEVTRLEGKVDVLRRGSVSNVSGTGGSGRKPGDTGNAGASRPEDKDAEVALGPSPARVQKRIERVLRSPSDVTEQDALLALRERFSGLPGLRLPFRRLGAVAGSLRDLQAAKAAAVGKEVAIIWKKRPVAGRLKRATAKEWAVETKGGEVVVPLDEMAPASLAEQLASLDPTLDHYLARAWFHLRAEADDEAWFDLQAVLVLSAGDEAARDQAEAWLRELRDRKGR